MNISELVALPEINSEMSRVDAALRASVVSEDPFLGEVSSHLISAGGKRLRPALAVASALTCMDVPVSDDVIQGAVSVELVHLGSLYHDDVLDGAETRRTVASVNARWGNFMAVISGDYLLAKASGIAATLGSEITALLASTIGQLCEGQVRELQYGFNTGRTVEAYEACISGKTASLLATSARIGALTAGLAPPAVEALTTFGYSFGMAFQIRDDILDIVGTDEQLGKPAGNDLVEGVYTLPVILALQAEGDGKELRSLLGGPIETPERDKAREIVRNSVGVAKAIEIGRGYARAAESALAALDDRPMTANLRASTQNVFDDVS